MVIIVVDVAVVARVVEVAHVAVLTLVYVDLAIAIVYLTVPIIYFSIENIDFVVVVQVSAEMFGQCEKKGA